MPDLYSDGFRPAQTSQTIEPIRALPPVPFSSAHWGQKAEALRHRPQPQSVAHRGLSSESETDLSYKRTAQQP